MRRLWCRGMVVGLCLLILVPYGPARADDVGARIDRWLDAALHAAKNSAQRDQALQKADSMWDDELNRVYQLALKGLKSRERSAEVRAEKAWLTYHYEEGLALYWLMEASDHAIDLRTESLNLVRQRVRELVALKSPESREETDTNLPLDRWLNDTLKQAKDEGQISDALTKAMSEWDYELNRVYRSINQSLNTRRVHGGLTVQVWKTLVDAEKAWLHFRDAENNAIDVIALSHHSADDETDFGIKADQMNLIRHRVMQLMRYDTVLKSFRRSN